jgi:ATP-grasp domain, R2K clade family 3
MVVAFYEESSQHSSINNQENLKIVEAARMFGCRIYPLPSDIGELEDAFLYTPNFETPTAGIWVGFIPTQEKYEAVYQAASSKNIFLLNTPDQHQTAQEFDRYYPLLEKLTPKSVVVTNVAECNLVAKELSFPLFVRGTVKSNKDQGWQACIARDENQLEQLVEQVLKHTNRARGRVIVRQLVNLRHKSLMPGDFPRGREYRVFIHKNEVLAYGYYWDEFTDEFPLTESDKTAIQRLALEAAKRVNVLYMMADVGQLESGDWTIIEVGDAQFAGLSHVSVLQLWGKLARIA